MTARPAVLLLVGAGIGAAAPLLTPLHGAILAAPGTAVCELPDHLRNQSVVMAGDVEVTIASESAFYSAGEMITLYLLYRNTGQDTVRIERPNSPMHGFSVLPDSCKSSAQPGCDAAVFFQQPAIVQPMFDQMVLAPGACDSWDLTWNGRSGGVPNHPEDQQLLGRFTVLGGVWERPLVMFLHHYSLPAGGAPLGIEIGPMAVEEATWGRVRRLFR